VNVAEPEEPSSAEGDGRSSDSAEWDLAETAVPLRSEDERERDERIRLIAGTPTKRPAHLPKALVALVVLVVLGAGVALASRHGDSPQQGATAREQAPALPGKETTADLHSGKPPQPRLRYGETIKAPKVGDASSDNHPPTGTGSASSPVDSVAAPIPQEAPPPPPVPPPAPGPSPPAQPTSPTPAPSPPTCQFSIECGG